MTNEEFQNFVLQKLSGIESDLTEVKCEIKEVKLELKEVKCDIKEVKCQLKSLNDQTANLTEFRTEVNMKLDSIIDDNKSINEIVGEHEVSIRTLRRRVV